LIWNFQSSSIALFGKNLLAIYTQHIPQAQQSGMSSRHFALTSISFILMLCDCIADTIPSAHTKEGQLPQPTQKTKPAHLHGNTDLHSAAFGGRDKEIARLIAAGTDVNVRNDSGDTPLHNAATNLRVQTIQLLIGKGADVNAKNKAGRTPLFEAARSGGLEAVKLLVANGAVIPKAGYTPLNDAASGGYLSSLNREQRREQLVRYFLAQGVDVHAKGSGPSSSGIFNGTTLHAAAASAEPKTLTLLLDQGLKLGAKDRNGRTPLHFAAFYGNHEAVIFLLKKGAMVDAKDDRLANTPLLDAVSSNNLGCGNPAEVVKALLKAGADPNARNQKNHSPLRVAISWGWDDPAIIRALLEEGANINEQIQPGYNLKDAAKDKPKLLMELEKWEQEHPVKETGN
jgi:ankyrin repeat protein